MPQTKPLTQLQQTLLLLDVSPKEARLYTTLLTMGQQSAAVLSKRLDIGRSTTQFLAESLVSKHLATKTIRQKITFYRAIDPQDIPKLIQQRKQKLQQHWDTVQENIESIVPDLEELAQAPMSKTRIKSYEGKEGVKYVIEDMLTADQELRTFFSYEGRSELLPASYFDKCRKRREEKNIKVQAIYPDTEAGIRTYEKSTKKELKDVHLVDHTKYQWEPEIRLYDDKVSFVSHAEQVGVIIESKMISEAMKVLFDLAWDREKRPNP